MLGLAVAMMAGCGDDKPPAGSPEPAPAPAPEPEIEEQLPPMDQPVDFYKDGKLQGQVDAADAEQQGHLLLDLGEAFTPYLFTERSSLDEEIKTNDYRKTYLALARGEFPDNHHGRRAEQDKYLELYGIPPTLSLLRQRFHALADRECAKTVDTAIFQDFEEVVVYEGNDTAKRKAGHFAYLKRQLEEDAKRLGVATIEAIDRDKLDSRDQRKLDEYLTLSPIEAAIRALQHRMVCEGFMEGKGRHIPGQMDWPTHEALAEMERRYRVYGWGFTGKDTIALLRQTTAQNERDSVIRVLTERAMHSAGVIEDGSTSMVRDKPRTFKGKDGKAHPIPNLEADLQARIINAFGLDTPEATEAWLDSLGELPPGKHRWIAIEAPKLPEYYSDNMDFLWEIDRGDVWYDFPWDEQGRMRAQPVGRRPRATLYVRYNEQRIPLARFGTTIGGWRSDVWRSEEMPDGVVMWKYKNSPPGPAIWHRIVAAPVWLPPDTTPEKSLLTRLPDKTYEINYHETGPSYASAYGLVAAYHAQTTYQDADGRWQYTGDDGIRSHGSVDYMSIMRRHSHGCHRLHNHLAVRLMSFVLKHRPHERRGQQTTAYIRDFEVDEVPYHMEILKGGYVFRLIEPVPVEVLEGRIRGITKEPIEHPIPKYNADMGAYILPDGGAVAVDVDGRLNPIELPDAGLDGGADGGVDGGTNTTPPALLNPFATAPTPAGESISAETMNRGTASPGTPATVQARPASPAQPAQAQPPATGQAPAAGQQAGGAQ